MLLDPTTLPPNFSFGPSRDGCGWSLWCAGSGGPGSPLEPPSAIPAGFQEPSATESACFVTGAGPVDVCGVEAAITPFGNVGPYGQFDNTGPWTSIAVTFSKPVSEVSVTADDPDYSGNFLVAYDSAGVEVARAAFQGDNRAGYYTVDRQTVKAPGIRSVTLFTAPSDYVGYRDLNFVPEGPDAALKVACTPSSVTRGADVVCSASVTPAQPYAVVRQKASGTDVSIDTNPAVTMGAGQSYEWRGPAVVDTKVRFEVEVNAGGRKKRLKQETKFSVTARVWPTPQIAIPLNAHRSVDPQGQMQPYPYNNVLGGSRPISPGDSLSVAAVTRVTVGPNAGLGFLTNPYHGSGWEVYLHPGLYPTPAGVTPGSPQYQVWNQWHDDQNGRGSGTCTQSVFAILVPEVERHEGLTRTPDSHYGVTQRVYQQRSPGEALEKAVARGSDDDVRQAAFDAWSAYHGPGSTYSSAQQQFDASDYPIIQNKIGCSPDYNPRDP